MSSPLACPRAAARAVHARPSWRRRWTSLEEHGPPHAIWFETVKIIRVLASSNYVTTFPARLGARRARHLSGRTERDARHGRRPLRPLHRRRRQRAKYYATYTAYDGFEILPQLIETDDFVTFAISTLNGAAAQNKGMALFPRRIGGTVRDAVAQGSREPPPRDLERRPLLERRDRALSAAASRGSSCRSATAVRRSRPKPDGSCSRTASGRCGSTRSARCCSISTIRSRSSAACANRCS